MQDILPVSAPHHVPSQHTTMLCFRLSLVIPRVGSSKWRKGACSRQRCVRTVKTGGTACVPAEQA
jgi:hypothetical protein